ncbi:MAG: nucleotidyltransferase domain-containing protein [Actinomycetota bacterium]|nr:nucleotidyltransferase domain-containing protein [Actinomycetota bacterium]
MDLSDPTRALTPTLDGPVLAVLAQSGRPLTVGQIAEQAVRGSEIGIRRATARLVEQGIVTATQMGRNLVHELNRDHIAAVAAELLADLRLELWRRLRATFGDWEVKPVYACAFGSAARGDGGPDSDIDLLIVHRLVPGESPPPSRQNGAVALLSVVATALSTVVMAPGEAEKWECQVDDLHRNVPRWTGNPLHVVDLSLWQWARPGPAEPELFAEIDRHAITLAGAPLPRPATAS